MRSPLGGKDCSTRVLYNTLLVLGVVALQLGVAGALMKFKKKSWREATGTVRFPSFAIAAAGLQLQGTAVYSYSMLLTGDYHVLAFVGAATSVAQPILIRFLTRKVARPLFVNTPDTMIFYKYCHLLDDVRPEYRRYLEPLMPIGRWGPKLTAQRFSLMFRQVRPFWLLFAVVQPLQTNIVAFIAALPLTGASICALQYAALLAVTGVFTATIAIARPFRVPFFHVTRIAAAAALMMFIAATLAMSDGYTAIMGSAASGDTGLAVLSVATVLTTITSVVWTVHLFTIKILERVWWYDDGCRHIWLDGGGMAPHVPERFDEKVLALLPASVWFPRPGEKSAAA